MILGQLAGSIASLWSTPAVRSGTEAEGSGSVSAPSGLSHFRPVAGDVGVTDVQMIQTSAGDIAHPGADADLEHVRAPYLQVMLAGGMGGTTGDMLMHSLDTVKTRQQGDPHMPPKYSSMGSTYRTIFRQEGIRGLYGGVTPAFLGSFCGTVLFFGSYEWSKRFMIDAGITPSIAYLSGGLIADLVASPIYVPSEVLKTRLQLQGKFNNPHFESGYNYRGLGHAVSTIIRTEGVSALFHGYKATLVRDLPFSALQFGFYEQEREFAKRWVRSNDIGLPLEIVTAASAGGIAGVITCPLDVVKTRVQTQQQSDGTNVSTKTTATTTRRQQQIPKPAVSSHSTATGTSTSRPVPRIQGTAATLNTSILTGLGLIYRTEGIAGWFRGVGPRAVWTSVQTGTMLVLYQSLLRQFDRFWSFDRDEQTEL